MRKPILVVSTGAGISAESGISTFRDSDGLWENYNVMEVCSATGFRKNPQLIHDFYNARRRQLLTCQPNAAHKLLVELEKDYDVRVITQNVDNLHEKAGSSHILHLHGELMKMRSIAHPDYVEAIDPAHPDTTPETRGKNGDYMRPHIVFFEEAVPNMEAAVELVQQADIFVVIGTSLVVYPAASLLNFVPSHAEIYYIDLNPAPVSGKVHVIQAKATEGMRQLCDILQSKRGL